MLFMMPQFHSKVKGFFTQWASFVELFEVLSLVFFKIQRCSRIVTFVAIYYLGCVLSVMSIHIMFVFEYGEAFGTLIFSIVGVFVSVDA